MPSKVGSNTGIAGPFENAVAPVMAALDVDVTIELTSVRFVDTEVENGAPVAGKLSIGLAGPPIP